VTLLAAAAVAYLIGAIPIGFLVARAFGIDDIRHHGSGNIGATNVQRARGPQHVGGADGAAAVPPDVADPERSPHEVAHRDGADQIRQPRGREQRHDQRSSSGTIAR